MPTSGLRKLRLITILFSRYLWRHKGLWLRALLCWAAGFSLLLFYHDDSHDTRFYLRGPQPTDRDIVVVEILPDEWERTLGLRGRPSSPVKELTVKSDSYFWNADVWQDILGVILSQGPRVVGVTNYFGENIASLRLAYRTQTIFCDPKVIWGVRLGDGGRILPNRFARTYGRNSGLVDMYTDYDGVVRHVGLFNETVDHMAEQIVKVVSPAHSVQFLKDKPVINYRGPRHTYPTYVLSDLLSRGLSPDAFKDKIVIISGYSPQEFEYRTPVGSLSRAEVTANIVDNLLHNRWVISLPLAISAMVLFGFVLVTAWVTTFYPQALATFFLFWSLSLWTMVSIWAFDTFYIWLPVFAPALTMGITYFVFLSFQLTLKEYTTDQLEKERQFLLDVEQLKNNFLSLISHDLKTPIAKIQGICDRIMAQYPEHGMKGDIQALRDVASELHRYIRTIIQIAKVESREFRLNKDATDLNDLIENVVAQLRPLADQKGIDLSTHLEPMFLVELDPVLMHEVVLNLIENAIKYTQAAGRVRVSSREVDDQVFVTVEDNGPGIPRDEQTRIFEKFFRGELAKAQPKGSGLGLYLVKYFIELHNGRIFLESEPGKGTRVGFQLPLTGVEDDTAS